LRVTTLELDYCTRYFNKCFSIIANNFFAFRRISLIVDKMRGKEPIGKDSNLTVRLTSVIVLI
jgi:hypothetical protein